MTKHDQSGPAIAPAGGRDRGETRPKSRPTRLHLKVLPELGASPPSAFRPIVTMAAALAVWRGLSVSVRRTLAAAAVGAVGRPPLPSDPDARLAHPDAR